MNQCPRWDRLMKKIGRQKSCGTIPLKRQCQENVQVPVKEKHNFRLNITTKLQIKAKKSLIVSKVICVPESWIYYFCLV